jgi:hypothetical protein
MAHKVFISQPMKGKTDDVIQAERESIVQFVKDIVGSDIEVMSSFFKGEAERMKPLRLLGMALELMSDADTVVFAPGWESARGCRIEHECAVQYGIHVIDLSDGQYERSIR